jgi:hypothetical protein
MFIFCAWRVVKTYTIILPSLFFNILKDFKCVSYTDNTNVSDIYDD